MKDKYLGVIVCIIGIAVIFYCWIKISDPVEKFGSITMSILLILFGIWLVLYSASAPSEPKT